MGFAQSLHPVMKTQEIVDEALSVHWSHLLFNEIKLPTSNDFENNDT